MEEIFEYLVPLQGLFKKKRNPKTIESYKKLDNFAEIAEDFKIAKPHLNDAVRIGQKYIFPKEKVTVFALADVSKAYFRVHGSDPTDEYGSIDLIFRDGSEEILYKTPEIDSSKVAAHVFAALRERGIQTVIMETR